MTALVATILIAAAPFVVFAAYRAGVRSAEKRQRRMHFPSRFDKPFDQWEHNEVAVRRDPAYDEPRLPTPLLDPDATLRPDIEAAINQAIRLQRPAAGRGHPVQGRRRVTLQLALGFILGAWPFILGGTIVAWLLWWTEAS
jgi:hypothetical protein